MWNMLCPDKTFSLVELEDRKPKISYGDANGEKKGQLKSHTVRIKHLHGDGFFFTHFVLGV